MGCAKSEEESEREKDQADPPIGVLFILSRDGQQREMKLRPNDQMREWLPRLIDTCFTDGTLPEAWEPWLRTEDVTLDFSGSTLGLNESLAQHGIVGGATVEVIIDAEAVEARAARAMSENRIVRVAGRAGWYLDRVEIETAKQTFAVGGFGGNDLGSVEFDPDEDLVGIRFYQINPNFSVYAYP